MDKLDRVQQLHRIFLTRQFPIALAELAVQLECSERTIMRDMDFLRNHYGAPLEYCSEQRGWKYQKTKNKFELPGIWFTSAELQSLALVMKLLDGLGEGHFGDELRAIENKLNSLLESNNITRSGFDRHIKILPVSHRYITSKTFSTICQALLEHRQLQTQYSSYNNQKSKRTLSPQTLVYYRENWYLDAWCHLRNSLRTFSLARFEKIELLEKPAEVVADNLLKEHFTQGYGIFSGAAQHTAQLRFYPAIAREIACQQWHPDQVGDWDADDYLLTIPYADPRELVQDILRHIPNVYVESPASLRRDVQSKLYAGLELFSNNAIPSLDE